MITKLKENNMHFFGTFGKKISQGKYKFMYMKIIGIMTINHTRDITSLTETGSDSEFSVLLLTDATEKKLNISTSLPAEMMLH